MDLSEMKRTEKFKYLKANGVKCAATMKTAELDRLMIELDKFQRGEVEEKPEGKKSIRTERRRVPLGRHRKKLSIDHLNIPKDKVARWVNDHPGRIQQALEGGYQFVAKQDAEAGENTLVTDSVGNNLTAIVGQRENGQPITAHLMVIDKDLYEEDQDYKQRELDELDNAIKTGRVEPGEGQYIPSSGIKYERT